jgi:hypothetical protein
VRRYAEVVAEQFVGAVDEVDLHRQSLPHLLATGTRLPTGSAPFAV